VHCHEIKTPARGIVALSPPSGAIIVAFKPRHIYSGESDNFVTHETEPPQQDGRTKERLTKIDSRNLEPHGIEQRASAASRLTADSRISLRST
jgi:hypothetical protein